MKFNKWVREIAILVNNISDKNDFMIQSFKIETFDSFWTLYDNIWLDYWPNEGLRFWINVDGPSDKIIVQSEIDAILMAKKFQLAFDLCI